MRWGKAEIKSARLISGEAFDQAEVVGPAKIERALMLPDGGSGRFPVKEGEVFKLIF